MQCSAVRMNSFLFQLDVAESCPGCGTSLGLRWTRKESTEPRALGASWVTTASTTSWGQQWETNCGARSKPSWGGSGGLLPSTYSHQPPMPDARITAAEHMRLAQKGQTLSACLTELNQAGLQAIARKPCECGRDEEDRRRLRAELRLKPPSPSAGG